MRGLFAFSTQCRDPHHTTHAATVDPMDASPHRRPARKRLSDLSVNFVSLVDRGDNPEARVVLWKRDPGSPRDPNNRPGSSTVGGMTTTAQEGDTTQPEPGDVVELDKAGLDEVRQYVDHVEAVRDEAVAKAAALEAELEELRKGSGKPFKGAAKPFGAKGDDDDEDDDGDDADSESGDDDEDDEDDDAMDKRAAGDGGVGDILKGAPPEIVEIFKRQSAELDELRKSVSVEREHRLEVEFAKRADALKGLGGDPDDLADLLKAAFTQMDVDTYTRWEATLAKAAMAADEAGLFAEIGHAGSDEPEGDKLDQLLKMTDPAAVAKHGGGDGDNGGRPLSPAELIAKLDADPDVYNEHEQALRLARRGGA